MESLDQLWSRLAGSRSDKTWIALAAARTTQLPASMQAMPPPHRAASAEARWAQPTGDSGMRWSQSLENGPGTSVITGGLGDTTKGARLSQPCVLTPRLKKASSLKGKTDAKLRRSRDTWETPLPGVK